MTTVAERQIYIKRMDRIFDSIFHEREVQEQLKAVGKFTHTCADLELGDIPAALVLGEEFGEVCRAVLNGEKLATDTPDKASQEHLRKELVQVAAVAVAWIEKLDKRSEQVEGLQL